MTSTETIPASAPYEVLDTLTGEIVYRTVYGRRKHARTFAEKKNQAWGAYRYSARLSPSV